MITARKVIGAHARFFPSGVAFTLPEPGGTAGRSVKPGADDPAWIDLGISDWNPQNTSTTEVLMAPAPGARQAYDEIVTSKGLTYTGTLKEMSNFAWQLLLSTLPLPAASTAGGQYNPLEGAPKVNGWLKIQQYDQNDVLLNTKDIFVSLRITSEVAMGEAPVDIAVQALVLFSTLNTGTLT